MHIDRQARETSRAAQIAGRYSGLRIQLALRRTERRIDLRGHGTKSVVVALTYCLFGLLLPLPVLHYVPNEVSPIVPLLRVSSYFCAMLGIVIFAALMAARGSLHRFYASHRSWRVLARAAAEHGRR